MISSDQFETTPPPVEELLNAYLDDELDPGERVAVERALENDPSLGAELAALAGTRLLVRDLPLLEMPEEFAQRLARRSPVGPVARPRRRSRVKMAALSAAASVAFWGGVATTGDAIAVVPDLAGVVSAHSNVAGEGHHERADPSVLFTAPGSMDGFELVYASRRGDVVHAMYTDGERDVSLFEQPGRVDWDQLPATGRFLEIAAGTAWTGTVNDQSVLIMSRGAMVYMLVASGDQAMAEMSEMSESMPGDDDNWFDQLRRASRRTTEFWGLSG